MNTDVQLYVAQKAVIEKNGEVLVLVDPITGFDLPGGKIQEGESAVESLEREVSEEIGLQIQIGRPFYTRINTLPATHEFPDKQVYVVAFACSYLSGEVTLSSEHSSYRWVNKDTYLSINDGTWFFSILQRYFEL